MSREKTGEKTLKNIELRTIKGGWGWERVREWNCRTLQYFPGLTDLIPLLFDWGNY
jgi:hypothetical protein